MKKKTYFFSNNVYSGKNIFLKICFFSSVFSKKNLKCVYFTFESCLSLILASGSQLNVKTIKYIKLIVLAGCFIIKIPYHLNM